MQGARWKSNDKMMHLSKTEKGENDSMVTYISMLGPSNQK